LCELVRNNRLKDLSLNVLKTLCLALGVGPTCHVRQAQEDWLCGATSKTCGVLFMFWVIHYFNWIKGIHCQCFAKYISFLICSNKNSNIKFFTCIFLWVETCEKCVYTTHANHTHRIWGWLCTLIKVHGTSITNLFVCPNFLDRNKTALYPFKALIWRQSYLLIICTWLEKNLISRRICV
jgi:hypothetical protein